MRRLLLLGVLALACSSTKEPAPRQPVGSVETAAPPASSSPSSDAAVNCKTDADCRAFSDYCTGCDCRALSVTEPDPVCDGPGVRCVVDPCMNVQVGCNQGRCTAGDFAYQSK